MLKIKNLILFGTFLAFFIVIEPSWAGPGGKIASTIYDTFWGKVLLIVILLIIWPLVLFNSIKKHFAIRRSLKDISYVSTHNADFNWIDIKQRLQDCFNSVHLNWETEDLSKAGEWMTDWYWQNQQRVHLQRWRMEGLKNICKVKKISSIKPILFVHRNGSQAHEGSVLIVEFEAVLKDYLQDKNSGKVVEGNRLYKRVRSVWTFKLVDSRWKVNNIEESHVLSTYSGMIKDLPPIETTIRASNA